MLVPQQEVFKHLFFGLLPLWTLQKCFTDNPENAFAVSGCLPRNSLGSLWRSHPEFHFARQIHYATEYIF